MAWLASSPAFRCTGGETGGGVELGGTWYIAPPPPCPLPSVYLPSPQFSRGQIAKTQIS